MAMPLENHAFEPKFYSRRNPSASPFWKIVQANYDELENIYAERFAARYGFWRPAINIATERFIKCGDLREGFAIVRCDDCGHSLFVSFSCKVRCFCPSCHQKRVLELSMHVREEAFATVPQLFSPSGNSLHWHPHVHAVVSDGVFTSDLSACGHALAGGAFIPQPTLAVEPFLKLYIIIWLVEQLMGLSIRRTKRSLTKNYLMQERK